MEYFEIALLFKENSMKALVVKQQTPAEIIDYAHIDIDAEKVPLQNQQRFGFVNGAFNGAMTDEFEDTPQLRNGLYVRKYTAA